MPAQVNQDDCTGCADCVEVCPVEGTIELADEKAAVHSQECIECNACVDACTTGAMVMSE